MDYYDEDFLNVEAPCEFCGQLFPLAFLIEHQSIHMEEDDVYEYPLFDDNAQNVGKPADESSKNIIKEKENVILEAKITVEEKQTKSSDIKIEPKITVEEKEKQGSDIKDEKKQPNQLSNAYFGDSDIGIEKHDMMPIICQPPLIDDCTQEKEEEEIELSDDDSGESLEEFWKRARDFLKKNRAKVEC